MHMCVRIVNSWRLFLGVLVCFLNGIPEAVSQHTFKWTNLPGGRVAELASAGDEEPGFELMTGDRIGVDFITELADPIFRINHNLANGAGVALGDVNGDGLCDVFLASLTGTCRLYLNQGNWKFLDHTKHSGIQLSKALATGVMLEDLDGDGDLDVLVNLNGTGTRLWLNDGTGTFRHATPKSFLSRTGPNSMALGDVNGDGRLDLFVANYGENTMRSGAAINVKTIRGRPVVTGRWRNRIKIIGGELIEQGEPNHLLLQTANGDFTRTSWTDGRFLDSEGKALDADLWDMSLSVRMQDLNQDGLTDIYVSNDFQAADRVWMNQGQGSFKLISPEVMSISSHYSMAIDVADINRDGWDDLMTVDMLSRFHHLRMTQMSIMSPDLDHITELDRNTLQVRRNTLQINRGNGTYAELARYAGVEAGDWAWALAFLDVDMDGWDDVLICNGHIMDTQDMDTFEERKLIPPGSKQKQGPQYPVLKTPNVAFKNNRNLTFKSNGDSWGFNHIAVSNSLALGDLDNDGDLDVVINCLNGPPLFYRNKAANPRVVVRLKGSKQNTSGIGARIALGTSSSQDSKEMIAGGRFLSDDQNIKTFALAENEQTSVIQVKWPDGWVSEMSGIKSGRIYEISAKSAIKPQEGSSIAKESGSRKTLFTETETPIDIPTLPSGRFDWEWQPVINRSLSRHGKRAMTQYDEKPFRDQLVVAGSPAEKQLHQEKNQQITPLSHEAFAWRDAAGNVQLTFDRKSSDPQKAPINSPLKRTAPFAFTDVNRDGILDAFVGMPPMPISYPMSTGSQLYFGTKDGFEKVEETDQLSTLGNVQDVAFADFDGDGWVDLAVAADWAPMRLFRNMEGKFIDQTESLGLSSHKGWWNTIAILDADNDGDLDIAAANWGRNTRYQKFLNHPVRLFYGDSNSDGVFEGLEAWYDVGSEAWYPMEGLGRAEKVFPFLRNPFPTHAQFAKASVTEVFKKLTLPKKHVEITTLDSMLFINQGSQFEATSLTEQAQWSVTNDILASDFDLDGNMDLILCQNEVNGPEHMGNIDAGVGLVLRGKGDGTFKSMTSIESGINLSGLQKAAWVGDVDGDARPDLWVQAEETIHVFHGNANQLGWRFVCQIGLSQNIAAGARYQIRGGRSLPVHSISLTDGRGGNMDGGTLLPQPVANEELWIQWPNGEEQRIPLPQAPLKMVRVIQGETAIIK